ncbi:MAG: substrate-binding domain-containing protein, partial [Gammaproteobacteria bacterium]
MNKITAIIGILLLQLSVAAAAEQRLRLATTTSTDNSGLLAVLHPPFEQATGIRVNVIAVGTGRALKLGENGDVDVLLVHAPAAEKEFVATGFGVGRLPVMHNDFVLAGPENDPVAVRDTASIGQALQAIADGGADFISRGDDSGTHKKEQSLWRAAAIQPAGDWYLSVGQGMGAVLRIADNKQAYTLVDRGTWLAYRDKVSLVILSEGGVELFNPYHVIMVNPQRHKHVQPDLAQQYIQFIRGETGQAIIRD